MRSGSKVTRRDFVRLCASAAAIVSTNPTLLAEDGAPLRRYARVQLIDHRDRPLAIANLKVGENYLFHYPYTATPCFLLNLGKPASGAWLQTEDGRRYHWDGGIGPQRAVVAFSAICAHRMSHPAREVSFINYRHERVNFQDANKQAAERAQIIYCCSEKSVYDPIEGGRVLGGPAKQPLAAIVLEQEANGALYAIGTAGGELFDRFFNKFYFRLALEWRSTNVRQAVTDTARVVPLADYCKNQILC